MMAFWRHPKATKNLAATVEETVKAIVETTTFNRSLRYPHCADIDQPRVCREVFEAIHPGMSNEQFIDLICDVYGRHERAAAMARSQIGAIA